MIIPQKESDTISEQLARREARRASARRFGASWAEHLRNEEDYDRLKPRFNLSGSLAAIALPIVTLIVVKLMKVLSYEAFAELMLATAAVMFGIRRGIPWLRLRRRRGERVIYERPDKPPRK